MFVLGITGPIGSGKSTVSRYFGDREIVVLDADQISRDVTASEGDAIAEIEEEFGSKAINADRSLNRKYMADVVFKDNRKLDQLSSIIHKHVFIVMDKVLEEQKKLKTKLVVLDVPIPVNKGFVDHCDQIWAVTCEDHIRLQRLLDRGMSKEDALRRIAVQMTNDEYAALGDHVIDNSGTFDELNGKIEDLIKSELNERGIRV
ncbi:MAG: dephospho-CoA kinase [Clostridiales bacterium]|nr:dephospho-CoA kinase [Clostridiales bacterium]